MQRGRHRGRVRVVRVVDDRDPVGALEHVHPSLRHQPQLAQPGRHLVERDTGGERDGRGGERVADLMPSRHRQLDPGRAGRRHQRVRHPPGRVHADILGSYGGVRRLADVDDRRRGPAGHRPYPWVVRVEHGHPVGRQRLDQLALRLGDGLDRAELADVRRADVEHGADPRRRDLAQVAHVAAAARAQLEHQKAGRLGRLQHRVRVAELVVERTGRGHRRADARHELRDEVLGRRLAARPGQADHRRRRQAVDHVSREQRHRGPADRRRQCSARRRPHADRASRPHRRPCAAAAKSCPSTFSPSNATNSPPGETLRESNSTVPVTRTWGSDAIRTPPTAAEISASDNAIMPPHPPVRTPKGHHRDRRRPDVAPRHPRRPPPRSRRPDRRSAP